MRVFHHEFGERLCNDRISRLLCMKGIRRPAGHAQLELRTAVLHLNLGCSVQCLRCDKSLYSKPRKIGELVTPVTHVSDLAHCTRDQLVQISRLVPKWLWSKADSRPVRCVSHMVPRFVSRLDARNAVRYSHGRLCRRLSTRGFAIAARLLADRLLFLRLDILENPRATHQSRATEIKVSCIHQMSRVRNVCQTNFLTRK